MRLATILFAAATTLLFAGYMKALAQDDRRPLPPTRSPDQFNRDRENQVVPPADRDDQRFRPGRDDRSVPPRFTPERPALPERGGDRGRDNMQPGTPPASLGMLMLVNRGGHGGEGGHHGGEGWHGGWRGGERESSNWHRGHGWRDDGWRHNDDGWRHHRFHDHDED